LFPGFNPLGEVFRTGQNLALSWRRVISPQIVNEFTAGYSRFNFFFSLNESNKVSGALAAFAQECFGTDSFGNIDSPYCNTPHTQRAVSTIQLIDNLSVTKGSHLFRGGFNIRMYRHNDERGVPGGFNMSPTIVFSRSIRSPYTVQTAPTANCPAPPAPCTFPTVSGGVGGGAGQIESGDDTRLQQTIVELIGIPARVQQVFQADLAGNKYTRNLFVMGTRAKQFNFYVQDEWKIRRNLTVTYGLRWEWNLPAKDCCDRVFVPDRKIDTWSPTSPVTFVKASSWFGRDNASAFAPRVSLAWQPFADGKTVVRAGWGISFDTLSTFQVTAISGKVPGSTLQCNVNVQGAAPAACPGTDIPDNLRLAGVLAAFNPFTLPIPTTTPSLNFSPTPQALGVAPGVGAFDPNLKVPTVHQWNLTIQRELPWGFTVETGYIGRRGMRLFRAYDLNQFKDNPALIQNYILAQRNVFQGCDPDGTVLGSSTVACATAAGTPTILLALFGASGLNSSTTVGELNLSAFGDTLSRIDQQTGTSAITSRINPATGLPFPADYIRPNPQFSDIFYFDSGGSSSYHGLIVNVRRRFERGLTMGFSYTFSKSIDDMSVDPVAATSGGGLSTTNSRTPTNVRNFGLDRSRSDFDNKHVMVANWLYELPFGKGRRWGNNLPGVLDQIVGGWTWTGIVIRQSGEPFTINSGSRTVHNTKQSRAEIRGPMIHPQIQDSLSSSVIGPVVWNVGSRITTASDPNYNCRNVLRPDGSATSTYFCIPGPGESGSGRNSANGIPFWNIDLGILKTFNITERVKLQFRTEFFNVFNHTNFENPRNASTGSPTVTSGLFGQTCCVSAAIASSTTVIAVGEPNRVIQFGFKVQF